MKNLAAQLGLEPTTLRLTAERLVAASRCKHNCLDAPRTYYRVNWGGLWGYPLRHPNILWREANFTGDSNLYQRAVLNAVPGSPFSGPRAAQVRDKPTSRSCGFRERGVSQEESVSALNAAIAGNSCETQGADAPIAARSGLHAYSDPPTRMRQRQPFTCRFLPQLILLILPRHS
jgi:hypothetical protein